MKRLACWLISAGTALAGSRLEIPPPGGFLNFDLRPSVEAVVWAGETPPTGLFDSDDKVFVAPVLRLDAEAAAGEQLFLHATARIDRGFDPVSREQGDIRLDEITLRWQVFDDQRLQFQVGRFPTVFGAWQAGHDFFDDPFLLPPLPYSQIVGVQTRNPAAVSPAAILGRANGTSPPVSALDKDNWASVIWGPAYATGASVFGATEHFDYAAEIKNTALSSHPDSWAGNGFGHPSFGARLGYRPDAAWAFGLSASRGPWLEDSFPGADRDDLQQTLFGLDARWAHRNLVISGEVIVSGFETPAAGTLRTSSWFLGARWKVSPGVWLAARFGQTFANDADGPGRVGLPWQPDVWRSDIGIGWRVTPDVLLKAGHFFTHTKGADDSESHLAGLGVGWRF
jgi:hypothetical protein